MHSEKRAQNVHARDDLKNRFAAWWSGDDADPGSPAQKAGSLPSAETAEADRVVGIEIEADGYVRLKHRLMAWWNGPETGEPKEPDDPRLEIKKLTETISDCAAWSESRVKLNNVLWGEGFIRPNGQVFAEKLMAGLRLDSRKTILDIAPGLCETALIMIRHKNLWIEAIESDTKLMQAAQRRLATDKNGHQVDLRREDLASFELPPLRYHIIYGREHLYAFENKDHIVNQLCRSLKDHGKLLVFDYVVREGRFRSAALEAWRELEPERVNPWTVDEYRQAFENGGLSLRGRDDFTELMISEIKIAWHRMMQGLETGEVSPQDVDNIMQEGRLWQSRLRALQSGDLKLLRLDARKVLKNQALDPDVDGS